MKTDSIFYRLFQTFPGTFFELINRQATEASAYEFASVELKQTAFRVDGVFLPVPNLPERPIDFLEVQFQKALVCSKCNRSFISRITCVSEACR
jgi:predicted transposase/invertase (TIGR01784 family)